MDACGAMAFELKDGVHRAGIDPTCQEYMLFEAVLRVGVFKETHARSQKDPSSGAGPSQQGVTIEVMGSGAEAGSLQQPVSASAPGSAPSEALTMRALHITQLAREAIYKTGKALLWDLEGELGELQCDNQDVVETLRHPTSRNIKLVQLIQRL
ncbi:hypothetical protein CYMTET_17060 [Cymbomonas tetramitiformis]|uniref:Uncharacterized protein n=1 Tax=Cymbomonas tetramitiformis TaxID=36881 RepID=A0AAE0L7P5_9CHLO|nr:hypothetical protein CYMTET_17060 [Cymbomonas tetramitiformis]